MYWWISFIHRPRRGVFMGFSAWGRFVSLHRAPHVDLFPDTRWDVLKGIVFEQWNGMEPLWRSLCRWKFGVTMLLRHSIYFWRLCFYSFLLHTPTHPPTPFLACQTAGDVCLSFLRWIFMRRLPNIIFVGSSTLL